MQDQENKLDKNLCDREGKKTTPPKTNQPKPPVVQPSSFPLLPPPSADRAKASARARAPVPAPAPTYSTFDDFGPSPLLDFADFPKQTEAPKSSFPESLADFPAFPPTAAGPAPPVLIPAPPSAVPTTNNPRSDESTLDQDFLNKIDILVNNNMIDVNTLTCLTNEMKQMYDKHLAECEKYPNNLQSARCKKIVSMKPRQMACAQPDVFAHLPQSQPPTAVNPNSNLGLFPDLTTATNFMASKPSVQQENLPPQATQANPFDFATTLNAVNPAALPPPLAVNPAPLPLPPPPAVNPSNQPTMNIPTGPMMQQNKGKAISEVFNDLADTDVRDEEFFHNLYNHFFTGPNYQEAQKRGRYPCIQANSPQEKQYDKFLKLCQQDQQFKNANQNKCNMITALAPSQQNCRSQLNAFSTINPLTNNPPTK
jgi:hypothetical protein